MSSLRRSQPACVSLRRIVPAPREKSLQADVRAFLCPTHMLLPFLKSCCLQYPNTMYGSKLRSDFSARSAQAVARFAPDAIAQLWLVELRSGGVRGEVQHPGALW